MLALGAYLLLWDQFNAPPNAALAPANGVGAHPVAAINSSSDPTGAHTPRSTVASSQPKGVASDSATVVTEQQYQAALVAQECFDVRDFLEDIEGGKTKIPDETPSRDKLQQLINLRQTACAGITMRESSELIPIFRLAAQAGHEDAAAHYARQLIQSEAEETMRVGRYPIRRNYEALPKDLVPLLNAAVDRGEESAIYLLQSYYLGHPTEGWRYSALLLVARCHVAIGCSPGEPIWETGVTTLQALGKVPR